MIYKIYKYLIEYITNKGKIIKKIVEGRNPNEAGQALRDMHWDIRKIINIEQI